MTAQNKVQTKSVGGAIQTANKDMVDFKRLSEIHEAARKAIEEEEKHREPLTDAEKGNGSLTNSPLTGNK